MFKIEFSTNSSAFLMTPGDEVARILKVVAVQFANGMTAGAIHDTNGNRIGAWSVTDSRAD